MLIEASAPEAGPGVRRRCKGPAAASA